MERITTGCSNLDLVLGGGLPTGSLVVIAGRPGTGKTILAQQIAFANASEEHTARYYTTLSEPHSKLIRHLENFAFFDRSVLDHQVAYLHITEIAQEARETGGGLDAIVDQIVKDVYEYEPQVVVIDSSKALAQFTDPAHLRESVFDLAGKVSHSDTTVLLVGEYTGDDYDHAPEFAVADAIIEVAGTAVGPHDRRWLRVHKLRGSDFLGGQHTFEITEDGYTVHPRLESIAPMSAPMGSGRLMFGLEQVDRMLGGGIPAGDGVLVFGPSGAGKTTLAMAWLDHGLAEGETALFVSLEESREEIEAKSDRLGCGFRDALDEGRLTFVHVPTTHLEIDALGNLLRDTIAELQPSRIVIDALSDVLPVVETQGRFPSYLAALTSLLREHGGAAMYTFEVKAIGAGSEQIQTVSNLVHDVIVLRYMERGAQLGRVLSVMKMRNSAHDQGLLQFTIEQDGISTVGDAGDVQQITGWTVLGSPAPS